MSDDTRSPEVETVPETGEDDSSPTTADLAILSEPAGALISLDGKYTGRTTPATLSALSSGTHTVSLSPDGSSARFDKPLSLSGEQTLTVDLSTGSHTLSDGLVEIEAYDGTGSIFVDSKPDGATIVIDGRTLQWKTPQVVSGIKPGIHTVSVKNGWVDFSVSTKKCLVESGMVTRVVFNQEQCYPRSVTLKSERFDKAEVSVNGKRFNQKIPATVEVWGVSSFVSVHDDTGYYSFTISDFIDCEAEYVLGDPAPATASVRVTSSPAGAGIFVDGFDTGYATPYTIEHLSDGPHLISVSSPGYISTEQRVLLTDDLTPLEDAALSFVLESYPYGSLTITSKSEGAMIYLHGKDTGKVTPHTFRYMRIGTYDLKVLFGGTSQTRDDVTVLPDRDTVCRFDL
ncbi:PEGA domain-containing protein [Methanofollis tationis]|uniref:PEGA domain-containing protein n=1 Tax=Methanofollis tationis TaxID=81417 RepID=A0A7K4HRN9_9EURY|nr:PEGA domain-containing protein [Methanofollis tationis]NVO67921.1 PEGA domain-containing protein [Methanofollis tationis]